METKPSADAKVDAGKDVTAVSAESFAPDCSHMGKSVGERTTTKTGSGPPLLSAPTTASSSARSSLMWGQSSPNAPEPLLFCELIVTNPKTAFGKMQSSVPLIYDRQS